MWSFITNFWKKSDPPIAEEVLAANVRKTKKASKPAEAVQGKETPHAETVAGADMRKQFTFMVKVEVTSESEHSLVKVVRLLRKMLKEVVGGIPEVKVLKIDSKED